MTFNSIFKREALSIVLSQVQVILIVFGYYIGFCLKKRTYCIVYFRIVIVGVLCLDLTLTFGMALFYV